MSLNHILKPKMKGVFYGRYSSEGQSIRAQRNSVLNLAKKYKVQIIKEFLDEGVSAIENELHERAGILELIDQAEQKKFDFIAIQFSDRIARDPIEHIEIKQQLKEIGIPIVISATETIYDTDINNLNQLMMDGFAKFEVDNIKQRTLDGLKARVTMGKFSGGNSPYGYKYVKRQARFEKLPTEIESVKTIFDLYKKGEGTQSIAEKLPPKTSRTSIWTREKVRSILLNPFYAGFVSYNKRSKNTTALINDRELWIMTAADYITPIISKEEWEICWRIYNERRKKKVDPKFLKTSFLLRGLIKCKECKELLKTKDERTTSPTNKSYGNAVYVCPICKLKIEKGYLHSEIVDHILIDIRTFTFDQVFERVNQQLQKEVQQLDEQINHFHKSSLGYYFKQVEIKEKLKEYMEQLQELEKGPEYEEIEKTIGILLIYNQEMTKKINDLTAIVESKKREKELKQNVTLNREIWRNVTENVMADSKQIEDIDIRRLFIPLVHYISVDKDLNYGYQLRIDNKKCKIQKGHRPLPY